MIRTRRDKRFSLLDQFGVRGTDQLARDVGTMLKNLAGERRVLGLSTAGFFRPDLSLPAYAGRVPSDGLSPIYNFFDRRGGGTDFGPVVTRVTCRDYRGGRLTYDLHDGTDFVCPPGTPVVAAAPGVLVARRDSFLRGGLTACVDHGEGVVTQYTHLAKITAAIGEPLARGEAFALSGSSGIDMVSGFPWVPPHVHFMVWVRGRPVDPYLAEGESRRAGAWLHGNDPRSSDAISSDRGPRSIRELGVDVKRVEAIAASVREDRIRVELERCSSDAGRVAVLEDSLHHDRPAWPSGLDPDALRPASDPTRVALTLPLPRAIYRGARAVDAPWTKPRRARSFEDREATAGPVGT